MRRSDRLAAPMPSSRQRGETPSTTTVAGSTATTSAPSVGSASNGSEGTPTMRWTASAASASSRLASPPAEACVCLRPDEPERQINCRGEPGGELESRPVVHTAAERNEDSLAARPVGRRACEQPDVGGRAFEQLGNLAR